MLKYFTSPEGDSVAINPPRVLYVEDTKPGAIIHFNNTQFQKVREDYLIVVARLNEQ